jgi:DNA gyrase subunit B
MYISATRMTARPSSHGYEVVDNAVDESLAGFCTRIDVILNADGSCTVRDNGRGFPVDIHAEEGVSAAEVVHDRASRRRQVQPNSYKVSAVCTAWVWSVVNALSEYLDLTIWRQGFVWTMRFRNGVAKHRSRRRSFGQKQAPKSLLCRRGNFYADEFSFATLEHRLRELAFLNSGVKSESNRCAGR